VAALFKHMGIKNHLFPLTLLNPELQGVDPFDPNLTIDQIVLIAAECKQNFWYYIREVARVPGMAGTRTSKFIANRGNMALYWLFFNHITTLLIQIRQTGKSFSANTLNVYLLNIGCTGTNINLLTKDDTLRAETIEKVKEIRDLLPFYLNQKTRHDLNNTEQITVKSLNNAYKAHLPNKSPKMALNVGRGLTSPIFQFDEGAFLSNVGISLPAALAAGTAARDNARRAGEPYGTMITTTAGKKDDRDGRYMYNLLMDSAVWTEGFYDADNLENLELIIRKNSRVDSLRVNCTFNHRQLGYSDEWLRRTIEDSLATGEDADRDFFNVWTSGTLSSPLSIQILEKIRNSQKSDFYSEISPNYGYITRWYIDEADIEFRMAQGHFIMGIDSSEAGGGDDISLLIMDALTGDVVAAGNYNETNLITFAQWLVTFFVRFDNLTCVIERRSTGGMIIDYLTLMLPAKNIDPFKRLFNRCVNDSDEFRERFDECAIPLGRKSTDTFVKYKKHFGFSTSGVGITSRTDLYSVTLQAAGKMVGDRVHDGMTIDQITSLTTRNGRVDHPEGGHDDMVIAFLLCFWFLTQAKNLIFYGINSSDILVNNSNRKREVENFDPYVEHMQRKVREEIEYIYEQLRTERDEVIYYKLESRMKQLNSKLILKEGEQFSVDELLYSLRKEKRFNRTMNRGPQRQQVDNARGITTNSSSFVFGDN
jgi:hypothetical protein